MSQTDFSMRPRDFENIELPLKRFPCHLCRFSTEKKNDLKRHLMKHAGIKPFKCDQCEYGTTRRSDLAIHLKSHSGEKPFRCNFCPYSTARKNNFREHLMVHSKIKRLQCQYCNYSTNRKREFEHHEKIHLGIRPFNCNECSYTAVKKSTLDRHQKMHSSPNDNLIEIDEDGAENLIVSIDSDLIANMGSESPMVQEIKSDSSTIKGNLSQEQHTVNMFPQHFGNGSIFPQQMGPATMGTGTLPQQIGTANILSQQVGAVRILSQQMGTASILPQHMVSESSKSAIFSQYGKIEPHTEANLPLNLGTQSHTAETLRDFHPDFSKRFQHDSSKRFQPVASKRFYCTECSYSSLKQHDLKRHAMKHSGVKPFSCSQCSYRAFRKSDLTAHERTHDSGKYLACTNYKALQCGDSAKCNEERDYHKISHKNNLNETAKCHCVKKTVRDTKTFRSVEILEIPCYPKTSTHLKSEHGNFSQYSDELWKKRFLSNGSAFPSMSYENNFIGNGNVKREYDTNLPKHSFVNHALTNTINKH